MRELLIDYESHVGLINAIFAKILPNADNPLISMSRVRRWNCSLHQGYFAPGNAENVAIYFAYLKFVYPLHSATIPSLKFTYLLIHKAS